MLVCASQAGAIAVYFPELFSIRKLITDDSFISQFFTVLMNW